MEEHHKQVSYFRASRLLGVSRTCKYYQPILPSKDEKTLNAIKKVIGTSRKGRQKVTVLVRREHPEIGSSRIRRVYQKYGLSLYKRPSKRLRKQPAVPLTIPLKPGEEYGIDFMTDCLSDGRRFRILNIIDHHNRKCMEIFIEFSFPSKKVIECLERLFAYFGFKPRRIRTDNGPEFTSKLFRKWMMDMGIEHVRIQPGKPAQNAIVERFNRTYREEVLDAEIFEDLEGGRNISAAWKKEYNEVRPHESLGNLSPDTYAA